MKELWDVLPACQGEYRERLKDFPFVVEIAAMNWSNKEQRRLPIDETTKWGLWVDCTIALSIQIESLEAARSRGVDEAIAVLRQKIDRLEAVYKKLTFS